jgi:hypothetical protein
VAFGNVSVREHLHFKEQLMNTSGDLVPSRIVPIDSPSQRSMIFFALHKAKQNVTST